MIQSVRIPRRNLDYELIPVLTEVLPQPCSRWSSLNNPRLVGKVTVPSWLDPISFAYVVFFCSSRAQRLVSIQYVQPWSLINIWSYYSTFLVCRPTLFSLF
jgi:hypothetical protein